MRNVILSADGDSKVYSVPDAVADDLERFCQDFCDWLYNSPDASAYRTDGGVCYNEEDFIDYLNTRIFPEQPSVLVKNLGYVRWNWCIPFRYRRCPRFNF